MTEPILVRSTALLERDDELAAAGSALAAARDGVGSTLLVSGPPGYGRSALLRVLRSIAEQAGVTVLRAVGAPEERDFTCGALGQMFTPPLLTAPEEVRDRWYSGAASEIRAPVLSGPSAHGAIRRDLPRRQLLAGLDALLDNITADTGPVLVLVDDVQHADEPSLNWLAHLAQRVHHRPVLLVCAVREGDAFADEPPVHRLIDAATATVRPRPLSVAAVRELLGGPDGEPVDEGFAAVCHEVTGGVPAFVTALLDELAADGVAPVAGNADRVHATRPARLRDWLPTFLRAQPEPVWEVALAVAALGRHADPDLIGRLTDRDVVACEQALRTLSRCGLLGTAEPRFALALVPAALDEAMTVEERDRVHVRAAEELHLDGRPAEDVAERLLDVLSLPMPWAAETMRGAADAAVRRGAPHAAIRYLRRLLLDDALDGNDRAAAYVALATAEVGIDRAASVRHITAATALLSTPRDRAAALVRISPALFADTPPYVRDLLDDAVVALGAPGVAGGEDRELVLQLEARARYAGLTDPAELMAAARRLSELGPDPSVTTAAERELLIVLLFATTKITGATAAETAGLGSRILRREPAVPGHVHGELPLLVNALCAADALDELEPWLDSALERCREHGTVVERDLLDAERVMIALNRGRLADAGTIAHRVLEGPLDWTRVGTQMLVPLSLAAVGTQDGELIRRLLAIAPEDGTTVLVSGMLRMLRSTSAALEGDLESSLAFTMDTGWQLERAGWMNAGMFPWRLAASGLHKRLGDPAAAIELAEHQRQRAREWGAAAAVGRATRAVGDLTPGPDGVALLREAVDVLEKSANRSELARALIRTGLRLRDDEPDESVVYLRRGEEIADECGDAMAQSWVRQAGERRTGAGTLTRAERRVAELAAQGLTNQEIARSLEVSVRAVEKHLTNSFRKLGRRRRTELADALRATGH